MTDRIFTREQLEAWDLPGAWAEDAPEILHREQVDTRRWVSVNELVFRAPDDGKAYRVYYDQGLTESQEDTDPWNDDREVKGTEVEQRAKTTMVWKDVRSAPAAAEAPAAPADLSRWATEIGAAGLAPMDAALSMQTSDGPLVRILFAVRPDMPDDMRTSLVEGLGMEIAKYFPTAD
ncbi:hypothetical protein ACIP6Q_39205 [Streptomyces bobili]|uniref:hypothetical protein n=1 Tax=Streptomyces bobili TaxID=67280 RepID=UPI0038229209